MSSLPPPSQSQIARAGSLTHGWKVAVIITHLLIAGSLLALAISSRTVGKPTWWFGSQDNPALILFWFIPFLGPIGAIVAAARNSTKTHFIGAAATLLLVVTGVVDITKTPGIAIGIILLGVCTATTTFAAIAGRYRSVTTSL